MNESKKPPSGRICMVRSPRGYICTKPSNHRGKHTARCVDNRVCDRWLRMPGDRA